MFRGVGKDRRPVIYHPETASMYQRMKREGIMFMIENDAYGFVQVPQRPWRIFQLFVGPLLAAAIGYIIGFHCVTSYCASTVVLAFMKIFVVATRPADVLSKTQEVSIPIVKRVQLSSDTFRLTMQWQSTARLGLSAIQHVKFLASTESCPAPTESGKWNGKEIDDEKDIERMYTPIKVDDWNSEMDFVIKTYNPCEQFCDGGRMGIYLDKLKPGQYIRMKGPFGKYRYFPGGAFKAESSPIIYNKINYVNLLAGGSGITPVLQLACAIIDDIYTYNDKIQISIIACNKTTDDILCAREMNSLNEAFSEQLRVHYVVDKLDNRDGDEGYEGSVGYINEEIIKNHFAPPGEDVLVYTCGPGPMKDIAKDIFANMKYKKELTWG